MYKNLVYNISKLCIEKKITDKIKMYFHITGSVAVSLLTRLLEWNSKLKVPEQDLDVYVYPGVWDYGIVWCTRSSSLPKSKYPSHLIG